MTALMIFLPTQYYDTFDIANLLKVTEKGVLKCIGVEYGGGGGAEGLESPPQRFYKEGSASAEILLN